MKNVIHNLKVFLTLISINIKVTLTYRASLFISLILNIFWVLSYVVFMEIVFQNVTTLGGLMKGEALLIMAFFYLFTNVSDILYRDSFEQFAQKMRTGYIDTWLTKPASSRLLMFMSAMRFDYITAMGVTVALFAYAFQTLGRTPDLHLLGFGVIISLFAHIIFFSVLSILATMSFWLEKNDTLNMLAWQVTQIGRYPRQIYLSIARVVFTYILPLALIANLPAEITLNTSSRETVVVFVIVTTALYVVSAIFWRYGLRRYSSAG